MLSLALDLRRPGAAHLGCTVLSLLLFITNMAMTSALTRLVSLGRIFVLEIT